MKQASLRELLVLKLRALYDIEHQVVKALPKMMKKATDRELKGAFETHHLETKSQIERLERVFDRMNERPRKMTVEGIRGIIADATWVMENIGPKESLDANLIAAARYVEHYEMAGYLAAAEWAALLGEKEVAGMLTDAVHEEHMADETLSNIGKAGVNGKAIGVL